MDEALAAGQARNARLRGKIDRILESSTPAVRAQITSIAENVDYVQGSNVDTLEEVFDNLKRRAIKSIELGAAKESDFESA